MTTIVTRSGKGSPLTHTEVDTNFTNLNTAKLEAGAIALGSAATPSISFTGDTNTGIYSPGADQVAVATNGSARLYIASDGKVGVGTTSPGAILHTVNTSAGAETIGAFIQNSSITAGTEVRLGFAPNTNVVGDNRYSWIGAVNGTGSNDSALTFATAPGGAPGVERMRITSAGLVGIGTSAPSTQFVVGSGNTLLGHNTLDNYGGRVDIRSAYSARAANVPAQLFVANSAGSQLINTGGAIDLGGYQDQFSRAYSYARIQGLATSSSGLGGYLSFMVLSGGGSLEERVRIDTAGNVGIGTTSPGGTLDIKAAASTHPLIVQGPSSEFARVDSSGRLLVGTSSNSGGALLQVNDDRIRVGTAKTPATSGATGTTGEIAWDANYIYVCTATNTWKRSAIATW